MREVGRVRLRTSREGSRKDEREACNWGARPAGRGAVGVACEKMAASKRLRKR